MRVREIEQMIDAASAGHPEHEEMIVAVKALRPAIEAAPDYIARRKLRYRVALAFGLSPSDVDWIWSRWCETPTG